jgi:hypothetical protein
VVKKFAHDENTLLRAFAGSVHGFGCALAQMTVMIDQRVTDIAKGKSLQTLNGVIGSDGSRGNSLDQLAQGFNIHIIILPLSARASSLGDCEHFH